MSLLDQTEFLESKNLSLDGSSNDCTHPEYDLTGAAPPYTSEQRNRERIRRQDGPTDENHILTHLNVDHRQVTLEEAEARASPR